jgi:effector-binding domain-containing protein
MSKLKVWSLSLSAVALVAMSAVEIAAESTTDQPAFAIRKTEKQVVLYTIYRGGYDKVGPTIGKLFALAGQKGITPRGQVLYVYLNNPQYVSSEHWLTEIRIPIGQEALKFAGTLGEITDVKSLPAMELAVAVKPKGQADPGPIYDSLYTWIAKQGYRAADNACERFLTGAMAGDYARMRSEIIVPVKKLPQGNK